MDAFEAMADPLRRALLQALAREGPARVVDLAARVPISRPGVSKHLRFLLTAGLLEVEDRGRERHYRLRRDGLEPIQHYLAELRPAPPISSAMVEALDLEVRRAARDSRPAHQTNQRKDMA